LNRKSLALFILILLFQLGLSISRVTAQSSFDEGIKHLTNGDTNNAIDLFKQALNENPSDYEAAYILGQLYYNKDTSKSILYYKLTLQIKPDHKKAHCVLGQIYENFGTLDSLVKAKIYYEYYCPVEYDRVTLVLRDSTFTILNRVRENLNQGDFTPAVIHLVRAKEIEPNNQEVGAIFKQLQGNFNSALARAISKGDQSCSIYDWAKAIQAYNKAIHIINTWQYAWRNRESYFKGLDLSGLNQILQETSSKVQKANYCESFKRENESRVQNLLDSAKIYVNRKEWKYAEEELNKFEKIVKTDTQHCIPYEHLLPMADSLKEVLVWTKIDGLDKRRHYAEALSLVTSLVKKELHDGFKIQLQKLEKGELKFDLFWAYLRLNAKCHQIRSFVVGVAFLSLIAVLITLKRKRKIKRWIKQGNELYSQDQYVGAFNLYIRVPTRHHRYFNDESFKNYLDCYVNLPSEIFIRYSHRFTSLLYKTLTDERAPQLREQGLEALEMMYTEEGKLLQGIEYFERFSERFKQTETAVFVLETLCRLYAENRQPEKVEKTVERWYSSFPEQIDRIINQIKKFEKKYAA
jgi:tetratricopeptide (TPR) repeat protein